MKIFKVYATETVIYDTVEIKADNFEQASDKYLDLFADKNTEPRVVDSNWFETAVDEMPEVDLKVFENFLGIDTSIEEELDKLTIRKIK